MKFQSPIYVESHSSPLLPALSCNTSCFLNIILSPREEKIITLSSEPESMPSRKTYIVHRTWGKEILHTCSYQWLQWKPWEHLWKAPTAPKDFKQWCERTVSIWFVNNMEYILCVISIHNCKIYGWRQLAMFWLQLSNWKVWVNFQSLQVPNYLMATVLEKELHVSHLKCFS